MKKRKKPKPLLPPDRRPGSTAGVYRWRPNPTQAEREARAKYYRDWADRLYFAEKLAGK